jgi:hypothetical protein
VKKQQKRMREMREEVVVQMRIREKADKAWVKRLPFALSDDEFGW